MKERQQRQALSTPQMSQNPALPLASPQPLQQGQITPQHQQQHQQQQQQQQLHQHLRPPPSQQQMQHQAMSAMNNQPQAQRALAHPQVQTQGQAKGGIQEMIMRWSEQELHNGSATILEKLSQPQVLSNSLFKTLHTNEDDCQATADLKFHLLQLIAEYKRRNLAVPNNALQAAGRAYVPHLCLGKANLPSSFGNPQFAQQLMALEWSQLSTFARARAEVASQQRQPLPPSQQPQQQQYQNRSIQQPNMPGSQTNPIEIVTPIMHATSQVPSQSNLSYVTPQLQPPAQINDQRFQHQPQPGLHPPQNSATQQWVQQQQQPPHARPSPVGPSDQPGNPWAGMDFKKEPFPMTEEQFWNYLGNTHLRRPEPMPAPVIEGKAVNLYELFNIMHKNGGSEKVRDH